MKESPPTKSFPGCGIDLPPCNLIVTFSFGADVCVAGVLSLPVLLLLCSTVVDVPVECLSAPPLATTKFKDSSIFFVLVLLGLFFGGRNLRKKS